MPKVSVIIPTYNRAGAVSNAIESVQKQTFPDWELLVIDDGSTDNTLEIVQKYASPDSRIRIFHLENNSWRPAVPRNYGLRQAKGEYIAFLDSDDVWLPEKLQEQVDYMEKNREIKLLYSKCYIEESGEIIGTLPKKRDIKTGRIFEPLFLSFNFIFELTVMMRNDDNANKYLFDEDIRLKAIEDFDLWLRIAKDEKIGFIDRPLAIYRVHEGSLSDGIWPYLKRSLVLIDKWKNNVSKILLIRKYLLLAVYILYLAATKLFFKRPVRIRLSI